MSEGTSRSVTLDISYDDTRELSRKLLDLQRGIKNVHLLYAEQSRIEFDWDMEALDYTTLLTEAADVLSRAADAWIKKRQGARNGRLRNVHAAAR